MSRSLKAQHFWIHETHPNDRFGFFGWPTVARLANGEIIAAASGFRDTHVCPYGKSVLFRSSDNGENWSDGEIINDSPVDDRDTGLQALPDGSFILSWFGSDTRRYWNDLPERFYPVLLNWDDDSVAANIGSFVRKCDTDGQWSKRYPVPVSCPHGPVLLQNGDLLFVGKLFLREDGQYDMDMLADGAVECFASRDQGCTWQRRGRIEVPADHGDFCEPHAIELQDGRIMALLRNDYEPDGQFSVWKCFSEDGGCSWSTPEKIGHGGPPHVMRHSSGTLILSVGWRSEPYGQRVYFSRDEGATWSEDFILRDDSPISDLGYPSTVELPDGSLLTVYYQSAHPGCWLCGIGATKWQFPDIEAADFI